MLTGYGKREWLIILALGVALGAVALSLHWWWWAGGVSVAVLTLLSFFRDPHRFIPTQRGIMVSPADGRVSSVHQVDHFQPFDEPAVCIRIFLSVLNVHVNRSPCHGQVTVIEHRPGRFMNALNPQSAEVNEATLLVLVNPTTRRPVAAVRQVAGAIARTIVCGVPTGQILQRGQRFGMIKFGSTTELYIPLSANPQVLVRPGQKVHGGSTILANVAVTTETDRTP